MTDKAPDDRGVSEAKVETVVDPPAIVDEFEDAFNEAIVAYGNGKRPDLSAADDPANVKDEGTPPADTAAVTSKEPVKETPPVSEATPPTPPITEQQPGESDEKYEQRYKTLQGIHKHDKETWETEKATLLSQLEEAKKPKTPAEPATPIPTKKETEAAEAFIDSLTDEQKEQLEEYEKDFDTVSKMEGIKRKVELGKLRKEMMDTLQTWKDEFTSKLTETETNFNSRLAPALTLAEERELELHLSIIHDGYDLDDGTHISGHTDLETYRDNGSLMAWIESKPKYLQPALKQTYEKGSAVDVIDLLSDFKRENNIPLIPSTPQPSDNVVQMNPKKAERKAALASVSTGRGAVAATAAAPSEDFDSAFDEALAQYDRRK